MVKSALLQARIEPELKKQGEDVLRKIGLSYSQFMTMAFRQLIMQQGLPFEARIPNAETVAAIAEYERDKNAGDLEAHAEIDQLLETARSDN